MHTWFLLAFASYHDASPPHAYRLFDTLVENNDLYEKYEASFPDCFSVGQAVAIWKEVANYQKTRVAE